MSPQTIQGAEFIGRSTGLLSPRQLEATVWCAEGKDNDSIGKIMGCSAETAKRHLMAAMHKLDVDNRTHLVSRAFARGLLSARLLCAALCLLVCFNGVQLADKATRAPRGTGHRYQQTMRIRRID